MQFVVNRINQATEKKFDGRSYLVAPVTMLVAGVLNDALVTAEEAGKYVASWNGRPATLSHPQRNGEYVSAGTPEINATEAPGQIWNAAFADGKLTAEIWIDILKATAIGGDALVVMDRLRSNQPVEVSTGYFADHEHSNGTHNGKAYSMIARNIRPDHLALLPDGVGACSWQDGCGTPRVNSACGCGCQDEKGKAMEAQELVSDIAGDGEDMETPVITHHDAMRIADQTFVSAIVDGLLSALGRGKHDSVSANAGKEPEKMEKEKDVQTPQAISEPVANQGGGQPAESAVLVNLAAQLEKLNQRIDGIDAKLTANTDKERLEMVATLAVNERCPFDEAELKALSVEHLRKLATAFQLADYSAGAGIIGNRGDQYETLAMPAWVVGGGKDK